MTPQYHTFTARAYQIEDDSIWYELYQDLRNSVKYLVHSHMTSSWRGQEDDIIEDITQETIFRVWIRRRKGEQGQAAPIASLPQLCRVIAINYCRDLRRHDHHLTPIRALPGEYSILMFGMAEDPQDIAIEDVWQEDLFVCVANAITKFPAKQRTALLTDLVCRMDFHEAPTPLQHAFLEAGIHLEDYRQPPTRNAAERNRYLSALSTAYKRLRSIILAYEADSYSSQATKRQKKLPAREGIQHDLGKVDAQISMILFVPSSLRVENMSSQAIAQTKTVGTEEHEVFTREIIDMDKPEKKQAHNLEEQDASMILEDPELATIALHLRQTLPPIVDPAYREALQSKLLEMVLAERLRKDHNEIAGTEAEPETNNGQITPEADTADLENDAELEAFDHLLEQTVSAVRIDPRFQEALQEKLLDVVQNSSGTTNNKIRLRILATR